MNMEREIPLTGGRITAGVTKKGGFVYRPCCPNADFVHGVLLWMEKKAISAAPRFAGISEDGREMITFLEGESPKDLDDFTGIQLVEAGKIIKLIHNALSDYPGCMEGQTVCHNDLSPCNFMFLADKPYAVFDWDTAKIGDPKDDLAYALWMWCDIGNDDQTVDAVASKVSTLLDGYGLEAGERIGLTSRILRQMERVGNSVFPTEEQTRSTREWVDHCREWLVANEVALF